MSFSLLKQNINTTDDDDLNRRIYRLSPERARYSIQTLLFNVAIVVVLWMTCVIAYAQTQAVSFFADQQKLIKAPNAYTTSGADLFGDKVNIYNGGLEFVQVDASIKGNNSLPVSIGRRLVTGQSKPVGIFGKWDLEIPRIHGNFSDQGWDNNLKTNQRCTSFGAPSQARGVNGDSSWNAKEFWHGNFLYVPGAGDQEMLRRNTSSTAPNKANNNVPQSGSYEIVTKDLWVFSCINLQSVSSKVLENGQGFLAIAPDGTRYKFDWLASKPLVPLVKGVPNPALLRNPSLSDVSKKAPPVINASADTYALNRSEVWIMPTEVTDRYGNWVRYTYDSVNKWKLLNITASDGRRIDLTYLPDTVPAAIVPSVQTVKIAASDITPATWTYSYSHWDTLSQVVLPDNSAWQLAGIDALASYDIGYVSNPLCESKGVLQVWDVVGTMTHPSGAVGSFTLRPTTHGRSFVEQDCRPMPGQAPAVEYYANKPKYFDTFSLMNKTITGPGLPSLAWIYDYGVENVDWQASWSNCTGSCLSTKIVKVTDPKGDVSRYTFGTRFRTNEGQLLKQETGWNGSSALRSVTTRYRSPTGGPYPNPVGYSDQDRGDQELSSRYTPVDQRVTTQQGVTMTWEVGSANADFDEMARPKKVTRSSSLGNSRVETTLYKDIRLNKWILGQVSKITESGSSKVMLENIYNNTTGSLLRVYNYGVLDKTYTYNSDGTVSSVKIGATPAVTTYSNYKRGQAQTVQHAGGGTDNFIVNDLAFVTSKTDAAGCTTTYLPDAMGRLKKLTPPSGDTVAWNPININFEQVNSSEFGLTSGHWRQTITTGNAQSITYLDAFWRPVLSKTVDINNPSGTSQMVLSRFDHQGKTTFTSYPQRDIVSVNANLLGNTNTFDALGRLVSSRSDSELGSLNTQVDYVSGYKKSVTNPKGQITTTEFAVFDEPSENLPTKIVAPEGVTVTIARDIFGKTTSVSRNGGGKSATRSYVYDANERLCKTIEPEVGATIQNYDSSNNISWKAVSSTLTTLTCNRGSVPSARKVSYAYDYAQRLVTTSFVANSTTITIDRTYTADGLPNTVTASNFGATWTSTYNKRRLLTGDTLSYNSTNYALNYSYTSDGYLNSITYPDNKVVTYAPNALGQASQVSNYATNINYHPNGAVAGFIYGNGIVHTMTQNARGLPSVSTDTGILADTYSYDANANVTSIADGTSNNTSRSMTYDNLDRLKTVSAPGIWGNASYDYDALDNITQSVIGSRTNVHNYDSVKNRLTSISSNESAFNLNYDSYDEQGNIQKRGAQLFSFDLLNRLTSATGKATYQYDGFGHRVRVTSADGTNLVQVYSPAGQLLWTKQSGGAKPAKETKYIYLNRHVIAEVEVAK